MKSVPSPTPTSSTPFPRQCVEPGEAGDERLELVARPLDLARRTPAFPAQARRASCRTGPAPNAPDILLRRASAPLASPRRTSSSTLLEPLGLDGAQTRAGERRPALAHLRRLAGMVGQPTRPPRRAPPDPPGGTAIPPPESSRIRAASPGGEGAPGARPPWSRSASTARTARTSGAPESGTSSASLAARIGGSSLERHLRVEVDVPEPEPPRLAHERLLHRARRRRRRTATSPSTRAAASSTRRQRLRDPERAGEGDEEAVVRRRRAGRASAARRRRRTARASRSGSARSRGGLGRGSRRCARRTAGSPRRPRRAER